MNDRLQTLVEKTFSVLEGHLHSSTIDTKRAFLDEIGASEEGVFLEKRRGFDVTDIRKAACFLFRRKGYAWRAIADDVFEIPFDHGSVVYHYNTFIDWAEMTSPQKLTQVLEQTEDVKPWHTICDLAVECYGKTVHNVKERVSYVSGVYLNDLFSHRTRKEPITFWKSVAFFVFMMNGCTQSETASVFDYKMSLWTPRAGREKIMNDLRKYVPHLAERMTSYMVLSMDQGRNIVFPEHGRQMDMNMRVESPLSYGDKIAFGSKGYQHKEIDEQGEFSFGDIGQLDLKLVG